MRKGVNVSVPFLLIFFLALLTLIIISPGCNKKADGGRNEPQKSTLFQVPETEENAEYINYRTFRNPDQTWGFTIFINNMPYRHYNKIPFSNSGTGFVSRIEAEKVANLFIKQIRNGDLTPKLYKKSVDTLNITINRK